MSTNPLRLIEDVYSAKVAYDSAGTEEEKQKQAAAANRARTTLRNYGYNDIADAISADGATAEDVRKYMGNYAKSGKTPTRSYFHSLGQKYGMSAADIDNLISWDDDSGQVYFGGKLVGKPDAVLDGTSYWSDPGVLDNAFNDYVSRTGVARSAEKAVAQENENLFAKYNQEYADLKNTNPFTTEEAKAILAKYDLAGLQGRDNAVASNAGSNGGNIDSFAAANAMRQQAALVNQGQMTVLEAHQQKLDHARNLLADMGVNIDRVFNQDETVKNREFYQDETVKTREFNQNEIVKNREFEQSETAKNNEVARKSEIASVSGYNDLEWTIANDPVYSTYLNPDGTLKEKYKTGVDFQALYEKAMAEGKTELAEKYAAIRSAKANTFYDEYWWALNSGANGYIKPQRTADYELTDKNIDVSKEVGLASAEASKASAASSAGAAITAARINADADIEVQKLKNEGKDSGDSGGKSSTLTGTDKQVSKGEMDSAISKWLYSLDNIDGTGYFKSDWNENTNEVYAARDKLNDAETYAIIKERMLQAGWTLKEFEDKVYEWKTNIAKKAAHIEGKDKTDPYAYIDTLYKWGWIDASEKAALDKKYRE